MKKLLLITLISLLVFSACSKDEESSTQSENANVEIDTPPRPTTAGANSFEIPPSPYSS